jgi:hypothetical protein
VEGVLPNGETAALHFANLTVSGNEITIDDLQIDAYLELQKGVRLKPPTGESIILLDGVDIRLVASIMEKLPVLDLGITASNVVPGVVHVEIKGGGRWLSCQGISRVSALLLAREGGSQMEEKGCVSCDVRRRRVNCRWRSLLR